MWWIDGSCFLPTRDHLQPHYYLECSGRATYMEIHALIIPNFPSNSNGEIIGDHVQKHMLANVIDPKPQSHQPFHPVPTMNLLGIMLKNRRWLTTFHTIIQPKMPMDGVRTGRCDRPLMPRSHQSFRPVPTMKLCS